MSDLRPVRSPSEDPTGAPRPIRPKRRQPETIAIRAVIADDHELVRQGLRGIIEGFENMQVIGEAIDGEEIVRIARELKPDVILMDVNLPRINGIEATRRIRIETPEVVIIGLSIHEDNEIASAMREAGASAYLAKGCPFQDLLNAIRFNLPRRGNGGN